MGVFNRHHPLQYFNRGTDIRGLKITTTSTWLTRHYLQRAGSTSLGSDHLPTITELQRYFMKTQATNRTFVNFYKGNWEGFNNRLKDTLGNESQQLRETSRLAAGLRGIHFPDLIQDRNIRILSSSELHQNYLKSGEDINRKMQT